MCGADNDRVGAVATCYGFNGVGERLGAVDGDEVLGAGVNDEVLLTGVVDADYAVPDTAGGVLDL